MCTLQPEPLPDHYEERCFRSRYQDAIDATFASDLLCSVLPSSQSCSVLPTVPFTTSSEVTFAKSLVNSIVVDKQHAYPRDQDGWTLIPATLQDSANTFAHGLQDTASCHAQNKQADNPNGHAIFLTLGSSPAFVDAAGRFTSEAYSINVTETGIAFTDAVGRRWSPRPRLASMAGSSPGRVCMWLRLWLMLVAGRGRVQLRG